MLVDIAVIGATGYTGRLVLKHLAQCTKRDGSPLHVAACGRDAGRVKNAVAALKPSKTVFEERVVDVEDRSTLNATVGDAKVVIACAGPFLQHGMPVVEACIEKSTHYVDITGEGIFVRKVIDRFHAVAEEKKVCIVPCCGFDSVPSDLSAYYMARYAEEKLNTKVLATKIMLLDKDYGGGQMASSGTLKTIAAQMNVAQITSQAGTGSPETITASDPYLCNPKDDPVKPPGHKPSAFEKDFMAISFDEREHRWNIPFVMAISNTRIVRRSAGLRRVWKVPGGYADEFSYQECDSYKGFFKALFQLFDVAKLLLLAIPFIRNKFLEGIGDRTGPENNGYVTLGVVSDLLNGNVIRGKVALADPYQQTGVSAAESALCLLEPTKPVRGGVLTPSTAFGDDLMDRLISAGWTFEITESFEPEPTASKTE